MNSRHIVDRLAAGRDQGEEMVLVTVYETIGSTYSKAGTRMLIAAGGDSQGLVSGGCLEGDLAERARRVLEEDTAVTVSYDMRDKADELFGLGVGCNGLIRVVLQALRVAGEYEPLASISEVLLGERVGAVATVIDSDVDGLAIGASLALLGDVPRCFGVPQQFASLLSAGCTAVIETGRARLVRETNGLSILYAPIVPVPRVLILGAGLDAVPLVNVAAELGWRVSIADHRQAYLERSGFERVEGKFLVSPQALGADLSLELYDAIVVMSHHLLTDRHYLEQLAHIDIPYLGLLGPPARRQRLLGDLGEAGQTLEQRLRGPVGIDIGADTAESIALSIAAEIQTVLSKVRGFDCRQTS